MRRLYLIRHCSVLPPGQSLCLGGGSDPPLTAEGVRECGRLARWFLSRPVAEVWSSPLQRCAQMAPLIFGRQAGILPGLTEMDMGAWEGLDFCEIREKYPRLYGVRGANPLIPPPGAELPLAAQARMLDAIEEILRQGKEGDAAVFTHGGVLRLFLCAVTGAAPQNFLKIPLPHGSVSLIEAAGGRFRFLGTHLPAELEQDAPCTMNRL